MHICIYMYVHTCIHACKYVYTCICTVYKFYTCIQEICMHILCTCRYTVRSMHGVCLVQVKTAVVVTEADINSTTITLTQVLIVTLETPETHG